MQCYRCKAAGMRLVRYQGGREIWACHDCEAETLLLDCHCCERRGVHMAVLQPATGNLWDCAFCGNRKRQCSHCSKGWITQTAGAGPTCSHCGKPGPGPDAVTTDDVPTP